MILREVMVFPQILGSRKVTGMSPFAQLFYRNLMHACDGGGVFENDPEALRTALYPRALDRVKPKTVANWLRECHDADLLRFYTDDRGRALGEFVTWLQLDTRRKRRYAGREQPPADLPQLFTSGPPGAPRERIGIEGKSPHSPPPAGGGLASPRSPNGKPRRFTRMPKLDTLKDELAYINQALEEILRPGGCAYNVAPTDPVKIAQVERLQKQREQTKATIDRVRTKLAEAPE